MVMAAQKEEKNALLSHEETIKLIKRAQNGDNAAKEILTQSNLGLVRSIVNKFLNIGYEREDLFQLGCIGLIKAIYKFNDQFDVKFSTYAVPMILGEIKRHLRDDGIIKVSRSLKQINTKVKIEGEILSKKLGREPTIQEISDSLGISKEDIVMALESNSCVDYLYDVIHEEGGSPICLIDKISEDKQESDSKIVDNILLKETLSKLEKRERQIIILRYFEDRTQSEIGKILGISQVQVSRIEKKVLSKIKEFLK
ncbi:RNA polymerase sporulation sigma factor SigF [Alkalithermobacter paradoxus]|uniref:RNA polymerase sigma factor n=1 Tax=Alkalithermobacter paradoxus TaxID=29349 RepID=A0A1V4I9P7_9FIRM|nr:RNA polymerase sigma-F factor [[Clostridium] thermoalcaliphilum]